MRAAGGLASKTKMQHFLMKGIFVDQSFVFEAKGSTTQFLFRVTWRQPDVDADAGMGVDMGVDVRRAGQKYHLGGKWKE